MKYELCLVTTASAYVTVEADSFSEAEEQAWNDHPLFTYHDNKFDLGDVDVVRADSYRDGEPIPEEDQ